MAYLNSSVGSQQYKISFHKALIMYVAVSLFLFFEMALQVSPSVMAFQLMKDLNIGSFGLGLMSGCYFYTYTAMQVPSGMLLDRFNPRMIITLSILVCSSGALLFSFAPNVIIAVAARMLMGVGSAFAFVSVLVVTADLFESKYFATLTGITQALAALGAMSGQLPISHLVGILGWRSTLLVFAVVGFILALVIFSFLRYQKVKNVTHSHYQFNNFRGVLLNRQTWMIALYACLLWAPMSGFASLWGVPFLVKHNGFTPDQAAFVCSLMWLGLAVASPLLGWVSTAIKQRKSPLYASALFGGIAFGLLLFTQLNVLWVGSLIFISGAACAGQALSFAVVEENSAPAVKASALALNNMAVVISGALMQPFVGWILRVFHGNAQQQYQDALLVILIAYAVAAVTALCFIKESFNKHQAKIIKESADLGLRIKRVA